jgi:hypothetical protein
MHSQQRIGIASSRTTDTGVSFRKRMGMERNGWTDGRKKGIEAFRHFAKERREYLLIFHSLSSVLVCFCLLFCFYDTSIGRQITSKKEEESNTTSFILLPSPFISFSLYSC